MEKMSMLIFLFTVALYSGCNKGGDELVIVPEDDDLVNQSEGKADTGYMSTLATELEGEFACELRLDVSGETAERRQEILEEYRGSSYKVKDAALTQAKYAKNKINAELLHMNLYSDEVEAETIELVEDGTIKIVYKVRLESIVSHEELQEGNKTIEDIFANPTTTVKVPADSRDLFDRVGDKCAEGFDEGSLANYNYFYYFNPNKEGCDIDLADASFTISSLAPPDTTYPEYDRLGADNKVTVLVIFGAAGHEEEVGNYDWGMMEWRDFKRYMEARDFDKVSDLEPGERFKRVKNGIEEIIDIISPTDIYHNPESDNIFKKGIQEHEVILYNGHSFYGSLSVLKDCDVYPDGTYQIFYMGSCWSYEYYTRQIFECRKTEDDAFGWDLADVVNDTESGWFHNNAEFSRILLTNIFAGVESKGKDGDRFYTWYNVVAAMNKHAIDTWKSQGTKTHEIMGVSGVKNNKFDPEATEPGAEGKRYESPTTVEIPDNDETGVTSEIVVTESIAPSRITLALDISHTYIGDLRVILKKGDIEIPLHDRTGGWQNNIVREYESEQELASLAGKDAEGSWMLYLSDHQAQDTGKLNSWSITLVP
ncbi:MAG: proprotein convertase P-domain-containing protein [Pseudomonadota bacterium]